MFTFYVRSIDYISLGFNYIYYFLIYLMNITLVLYLKINRN